VEVNILTNSINSVSNYYSNLWNTTNISQMYNTSNAWQNFLTNNFSSKVNTSKILSGMSSYLTSLSSDANSLKSATSQLRANNYDSSFNKKNVSAVGSNAITGTATNSADLGDYTVNVSKIAIAQVNKGANLNSNDKADNQGINAISIQVGAFQAKNISFTITNTDTNSSALNKMASAINDSKSGVTANVVSDSETGTSYLNITANKTGVDNSFNISDTSGNMAAAVGVNAKSVTAQNAEYTVNGKQFTSQYNTNSIDNNKVKLIFDKAENKDIKLSVGTDNASIKTDIKSLVTSYNKLINDVNANAESFSGAHKLGYELGNIVKSRNSSLESIGVTENKDNTLTIDDKKLDDSIKNNLYKVKDLFNSYNGISDKLNAKSNEVISEPTKYSKPSELNNGISDYYNYMSSTYKLPYSINYNAGLIINSMV
jgi:flagellar hook-associated protein 2